MRDIHCHILPGVDDGSRSMAESRAMLDAAAASGISEVVCTPHCRDPYFDYDAMVEAFGKFKVVAADHQPGVAVTLGFEVAHGKLIQLGVRSWAQRLAFERTNQFLLELDVGCTEADFRVYDRTIFQLQGMGLQVIIAHPERYRAIQQDEELAVRLVESGCRLQASANFIADGRLSRRSRCARHLFQRGLYSYLASDAHRVEHYELLHKALDRYGDDLRMTPL